MSLMTFFNRMLNRAELFDSMVDKLGVRGAMVDRSDHGNLMRRAVSRCMGCTDAKACHDWLADHDTADEPPNYCRNHDMFAQLKHQIEAAG